MSTHLSRCNRLILSRTPTHLGVYLGPLGVVGFREVLTFQLPCPPTASSLMLSFSCPFHVVLHDSSPEHTVHIQGRGLHTFAGWMCASQGHSPAEAAAHSNFLLLAHVLLVPTRCLPDLCLVGRSSRCRRVCLHGYCM